MIKLDHHPPHIFIDNAWYMITSATHGRQKFLKSDKHKELLREHMKDLTGKLQISLSAWVILDNHYHILIKSKKAETVAQLFRRLHGRTSFEMNKADSARGRQVWHNYWDTLIRNENDYWSRFNYIHHNPVKHGYVLRTEDWAVSSYHYYLDRKGDEWMADVIRHYPIVDFTVPNDSF